MDWKLLTKSDYVTTRWSGGTTTQLAIAPEGAVYADRDFLWRRRTLSAPPPWSWTTLTLPLCPTTTAFSPFWRGRFN